METFILIIMLCTTDPNGQEYCIPLSENQKHITHLKKTVISIAY
jgi:hypothetical protein